MRTPRRKPLIVAAAVFGLLILTGAFCLAAGPEVLVTHLLAVPIVGMAIEAQLKREAGQRVDRSAHAALTAGQVLQLPDGRAAVVAGADNQSSAIASGDPVTYQTEGVFEVDKTSGVVLLDGMPVYWDHSANSATYQKVNDRDFYLGVAVGTPASGDTVMSVDLNVQPQYQIDLARDAFDSVVVGGASLAQQGGAIKLDIAATNEAEKVDALSKDGFAPSAPFIVRGQIEVVANGAAATDINVGVANGTHASDADTIGESCFIHIDGDSLNILAESDDGTNEVNATDTTVDYAEGTRFEFWMDGRDNSDIKIYIDGSQVLAGSTFRLDAATGPLKLLAHVEKSSSTDDAEVHIDALQVLTMDVNESIA